MRENGCLVISLDFELIWGVFDTVKLDEKSLCFLNTRKVIPEVLRLFKNYNIHATWASVGMLFNNNWEEWYNNKPAIVPSYSKDILNSYSYGEIYKEYQETVYFFAPELLTEISNTEGQEIGTHTFSHYYCLEEGQNINSFREDLIQAINIAKKYDLEIKSLVFPRNQINESYLSVCKEFGITSVRSNPRSWYWQNVRSESFLTKISRTADAYFPLGKKTYKIEELEEDNSGVLKQMASRFLRPVESIGILRTLKLKRIKREMSYAAKNSEIYHLWWHPHNFGDRPEESLCDLKILLDHYKMLNKKYNFQSKNMEELSVKVTNKSTT